MEELNEAFGDLLRNLRNGAGMTQIELAERVNMKRTTIANIERGGQGVSLHQIYELANALGLKPGDLLPVISVIPVQKSVLNLIAQGNVKLVLEMIEGKQNATSRGKSSSSTRAGGRKKSAD